MMTGMQQAEKVGGKDASAGEADRSVTGLGAESETLTSTRRFRKRRWGGSIICSNKRWHIKV